MTENAASDLSVADGWERPAEEAFDYDVVLDHIGQMGKYQLRTCLWLSIPLMFSTMVGVSLNFTGGVPKFRCLVDGCANGTDIPWNNFTSTGYFRDSCYRFNFPVTDPDQHCHPQNISHIEESLLKKCDAWTYDTSIFESTIFTDVTTRFSLMNMSIATHFVAELDPK